MIYLPDDWIKNKDNTEKVRDILEELNEDVITSSYEEMVDMATAKLRNLGETTLVEKLENKEIIFGI